MKTFLRLITLLAFLTPPFAYAEVGQTEVIDTIATKPDSKVAILLLFQARPWNDISRDLLAKKLAFYKLAINSGQLVKQKPELAEKNLRIIILYQQKPSAEFEAKLQEQQTAFADDHIGLEWGTQSELATLANKP